MEVIRSRSNDLIKSCRRLADDAERRRAQGQCLLLGERLIQDWLGQGARLDAVLIPERWYSRRDSVSVVSRWQKISQLQKSADHQAAWFLLEGSLAEGLPGLGADGAPVAIAPFVEQQSLDSLPQGVDMLYFDGIQDPGNLGTVMRTAAAFGVRACIPGPGCADLWSPKTLRAAMGAHQRLDLFANHAFEVLAGRVKGPIRAADAGGQPAHECDLRSPGLWVLGAEGRGLSPNIRNYPGVSLQAIPMQGQTESFNAAVAQSLLLYEQYRQRQALAIPKLLKNRGSDFLD